MYYIILLIGLLTVSVFSIDDETFQGKCPFSQVTHMQGFDQTKFEGKWYEIKRYHKSENMDCIEQTYHWEAFDAFAGKYNIQHHEQNLETKNVVDEKREIAQTFRQPGMYFIPGTGWPVWVVQTDYSSYALLWSCWDEFTPEKSYNVQRLTVLARNKNFQINSVPTLQAALNKQPFDSSRLKTIVQDERCVHGNNDNKDNSATLTIPTIISTILMILAGKLL